MNNNKNKLFCFIIDSKCLNDKIFAYLYKGNYHSEFHKSFKQMQLHVDIRHLLILRAQVITFLQYVDTEGQFNFAAVAISNIFNFCMLFRQRYINPQPKYQDKNFDLEESVETVRNKTNAAHFDELCSFVCYNFTGNLLLSLKLFQKM